MQKANIYSKNMFDFCVDKHMFPCYDQIRTNVPEHMITNVIRKGNGNVFRNRIRKGSGKDGRYEHTKSDTTRLPCRETLFKEISFRKNPLKECLRCSNSFQRRRIFKKSICRGRERMSESGTARAQGEGDEKAGENTAAAQGEKKEGFDGFVRFRRRSGNGSDLFLILRIHPHKRKHRFQILHQYYGGTRGFFVGTGRRVYGRGALRGQKQLYF